MVPQRGDFSGSFFRENFCFFKHKGEPYIKIIKDPYFYFQKFVLLRDSLEDARLKLQYLQKLALYKVEAKEEEQQARIDLLNKDNQLKQQQLQEEAFMKKIL